MNELKILPVFVTGPTLDNESDRTTIVDHLNKNKLLVFQPDELVKIVKESETHSYVANYCLNNSFGFEELLSNISLFNIMVPISTSAIYELGQFNKNNTPNTIFVPKDQNTKSNLSLNYYININHEMDYSFYNAS